MPCNVRLFAQSLNAKTQRALLPPATSHRSKGQKRSKRLDGGTALKAFTAMAVAAAVTAVTAVFAAAMAVAFWGRVLGERRGDRRHA